MLAPSRNAVVIGGGITGTLTAHALLEAGWGVTLIEAAHIGAGSSSRTAAGIRQQFSTRETVVGMRYSVDFYRRWREHMGGLEQPIQQNGYLFLVAGEEAWQQAQLRVRRQREWGLEEVEAVPVSEFSQRFPFVSEEGLTGATWCPTDGFLRPAMVYQDASQSCLQRGAKILQSCPAQGGELRGGRLQGVHTPKGFIEADLFFDCTNAWSRGAGVSLGGLSLPISAYKRYLWFISRGQSMSEESFSQLPLMISPAGVYCRPENPWSLLVGWAHSAEDESGFSYEQQDQIEERFFHRSGVDTRPFEAWSTLSEFFPSVMDFEGITATTSGYYGTTPDHNPFLDYDPQVSNLIRLVGFSGHGAMFGPFTAQVGAALAEEGGSLSTMTLPHGEQVSLQPFSIGRELSAHEQMVI